MCGNKGVGTFVALSGAQCSEFRLWFFVSSVGIWLVARVLSFGPLPLGLRREAVPLTVSQVSAELRKVLCIVVGACIVDGRT